MEGLVDQTTASADELLPLKSLSPEGITLGCEHTITRPYEGEARDVEAGRYYPPAVYFVDEDLVVGITDLERQEFLTCYHEHFSRLHGVVPGPNASAGQRRLRFIQQLNWDEQGKMIRNLRRIRNV